jgi:hypothetical protein
MYEKQHTTDIQTGERVLIAPDLTGTDKWLSGNVIEVEKTPL